MASLTDSDDLTAFARSPRTEMVDENSTSPELKIAMLETYKSHKTGNHSPTNSDDRSDDSGFLSCTDGHRRVASNQLIDLFTEPENNNAQNKFAISSDIVPNLDPFDPPPLPISAPPGGNESTATETICQEEFVVAESICVDLRNGDTLPHLSDVKDIESFHGCEFVMTRKSQSFEERDAVEITNCDQQDKKQFLDAILDCKNAEELLEIDVGSSLTEANSPKKEAHLLQPEICHSLIETNSVENENFLHEKRPSDCTSRYSSVFGHPSSRNSILEEFDAKHTQSALVGRLKGLNIPSCPAAMKRYSSTNSIHDDIFNKLASPVPLPMSPRRMQINNSTDMTDYHYAKSKNDEKMSRSFLAETPLNGEINAKKPPMYGNKPKSKSVPKEIEEKANELAEDIVKSIQILDSIPLKPVPTARKSVIEKTTTPIFETASSFVQAKKEICVSILKPNLNVGLDESYTLPLLPDVISTPSKPDSDNNVNHVTRFSLSPEHQRESPKKEITAAFHETPPDNQSGSRFTPDVDRSSPKKDIVREKSSTPASCEKFNKEKSSTPADTERNCTHLEELVEKISLADDVEPHSYAKLIKECRSVSKRGSIEEKVIVPPNKTFEQKVKSFENGSGTAKNGLGTDSSQQPAFGKQTNKTPSVASRAKIFEQIASEHQQSAKSNYSERKDLDSKKTKFQTKDTLPDTKKFSISGELSVKDKIILNGASNAKQPPTVNANTSSDIHKPTVNGVNQISIKKLSTQTVSIMTRIEDKNLLETTVYVKEAESPLNKLSEQAKLTPVAQIDEARAPVVVESEKEAAVEEKLACSKIMSENNCPEGLNLTKPSLNMERFGAIEPICQFPVEAPQANFGIVKEEKILTEDWRSNLPLVAEEVEAYENHEIFSVRFEREHEDEGSVGLILTGNVEGLETEILVHKVMAGSIADKDGRLRKGDRLFCINGLSTKGMGPANARHVLKSRSMFVDLVCGRKKGSYISNGVETTWTTCIDGDVKFASTPIEVKIQKGLTGLGLALEGGKDSPMGDRPLIIKRIFRGGSADKTGQLKAGDQILAADGRDFTTMTHYDAWTWLKTLPEGEVTLQILPKLVY